MLAQAVLEFWQGVAAAPGGGGGPSGPPTSPSLSFQSGTDIVVVNWTNGDVTARTEIGVANGNGPSAPQQVAATVDPGETSYNTGLRGTALGGSYSDGLHWWVRHQLNGQKTAWVDAGMSKNPEEEMP